METMFGSLIYMAPEVIKGEHNEKCDLWALGIVIFSLYTGEFPFYHENSETLKTMILSKKRFRFHKE